MRLKSSTRRDTRPSYRCDGLAVPAGWNPLLHLTCHLGGKPQWRDDIASFVPKVISAGMIVAGAANGTMSLAGCLKIGAGCGCACGRIGIRRARDSAS